MSWLLDPFQLAIQQRALIGGALAAVMLAIVGTWVVLRGMTFLGDALVHGVVPGIAVALIAGFDLRIGAIAAAILMMAGINFVHRQTTFSEDTGIGLLFVGMLGLGVILLSRPGVSGNLNSILFGNALGVTTQDVWLLGGLAIVTIAVSVWLYRAFLVLAFNEQKAQLLGLHPKMAHTALLGLIMMSIVGSFQTVGTLLVFGLLVGPPATAALLVRRVPAIMGTAAGIGIFSVMAGLIISYHADTSGSATMAVVPIALFFMVLTVKSFRSTRTSTSAHSH